MAAPTNTFQTYQSVGNREDLIDIIENISPVDTFVTSNTGSKRATATFHEWQTDVLTTAGANKAIEGNDASAVAITPTVRTGNYTQILTKTYQISKTQEAIDKAGRSSEVGYQTAKNIKELARDIEYALLINASSAAGASGTARQLKGILGWIATTDTTGTGTADEALTETMLNDNLSDVWAQGGFPSTLLVGSFQKRKISNFSTNTRDVAASAKELTRAVDIYQSDFGTVTVRLHHQLNTTAPDTLVTLGEMRLWNKAWMRPVMREELAKTGDSRKFHIVAELTLESLQEKGSGKITELTTS
jgi:hypothetical protein